MESKKTKEEIISEFEKKRSRYILADIPFPLAVIGVIYTRISDTVFFGISPWTLFFICAAVIFLNVIYSYWIWRCPSCDRFLGRGWSPNFCSKCGIQLRSEENQKYIRPKTNDRRV